MTITILSTDAPATAATTYTGVSPAIAALTHEVRRAIVDCVARGIATPKDIAEEIGKPLGVVAYHVRMLRDYGVLEHARSEPRRGALQHYYGFSDQAVADLERARDLITAAIRSARRGPSAEAVRDAA